MHIVGARDLILYSYDLKRRVTVMRFFLNLFDIFFPTLHTTVKLFLSIFFSACLKQLLQSLALFIWLSKAVMLRHVDLFTSAVIAANSLLTGALSNQKPPLEQKEGVMEVYALAWKKKTEASGL